MPAERGEEHGEMRRSAPSRFSPDETHRSGEKLFTEILGVADRCRGGHDLKVAAEAGKPLQDETDICSEGPRIDVDIIDHDMPDLIEQL